MAIKITKEEFEQKFGKGQSITPSQPKNTGIGGTISDAFQGGLEYAKEGIGQFKNASNPLQAAEGLAKAGSGAVNAVFSPLAPITAPIANIINNPSPNSLAGRIVDNPSFQKFAGSKAGEITSRVAEDVANVANIAGAATGAKGSLKIAGKAGNAALDTVKPAIAGTGRVLKNAGESSYGITVNPSEGTARAMQTYKESSPNLMSRIKNTVSGKTEGKPTTEANTAARFGLMGTEKEIGVQAGRYMQDVWKKKVEPALNQNKGKLDMNKFWNSLEKKIVKENPELNRRASLVEGLNDLKSGYSKVSKVGLKKLQDYKSGWDKFQSESVWKGGKPIASTTKEVMKLAGDEARQFIYKNAPDGIKQDYIDYGNLKSIREAGIKSGVGDISKKTGFRVGWQLVMDKLVTPVATLGGNVLYKTGEGLEFIGKPGAKKVGDVVGDVAPPNIPNKQGGFVDFEAIAKSIDNVDKDKMIAFVDAVNTGKTPSKDIMSQVQKIADTMGLDSNMSSNAKLADDFNKILDIERQNMKKNIK